MPITRTKRKWEESNFAWETASGDGFTWDDFVLIQEIAEIIESQGDSGDWKKGLSDLPDEKKKRLVRLIMRRKGIKLYDESKEVKEISTKVDDVKLIISEVNKTKITMEMNHV